MMKWMEYKKRQSFRELYILPLQNTGLIPMTNPEKPNDPEQKYVITEKGKIFLGARQHNCNVSLCFTWSYSQIVSV
jgi:ATP-dependent DNA helicase RecG